LLRLATVSHVVEFRWNLNRITRTCSNWNCVLIFFSRNPHKNLIEITRYFERETTRTFSLVHWWIWVNGPYILLVRIRKEFQITKTILYILRTELKSHDVCIIVILFTSRTQCLLYWIIVTNIYNKRSRINYISIISSSSPTADVREVLSVLLFDSWFDKYRGVVCLMAVKNGQLNIGIFILLLV